MWTNGFILMAAAQNPFDFGNIDADKLRPIYGLPSKQTGPDFIPYDKRGRDFFGRYSFNAGE